MRYCVHCQYLLKLACKQSLYNAGLFLFSLCQLFAFTTSWLLLNILSVLTTAFISISKIRNLFVFCFCPVFGGGGGGGRGETTLKSWWEGSTDGLKTALKGPHYLSEKSSGFSLGKFLQTLYLWIKNEKGSAWSWVQFWDNKSWIAHSFRTF